MLTTSRSVMDLESLLLEHHLNVRLCPRSRMGSRLNAVSKGGTRKCKECTRRGNTSIAQETHIFMNTKSS